MRLAPTVLSALVALATSIGAARGADAATPDESSRAETLFEQGLRCLGRQPEYSALACLFDVPVAAEPRAWLGDAVAITGPSSVTFGRRSGANLLIVGPDPGPSFGMLANCLIVLAA